MGKDFEPVFAVGLMSGTSADGVDAALIRTDGASIIEFIGAITVPYDRSLRADLIEAAQRDVAIERLLLIEKQLTDMHVGACRALLDQLAVTCEQLHVMGFHGHTLHHNPRLAVTWQIGDAALLATRMATTVVSDFRRADIAQGGQGAPLAPLFHRELLVGQARPTMVLNLGGVANITWIGRDGEIRAGDTGPGCGLLDSWSQRHLQQPFDRDGLLARAGQVEASIVASAMQHDFFHLPVPKSADRYEFSFVEVDSLSPSDGAATLCAITATGVAMAVDQLPEKPISTWVTGGGSQHPGLMRMLQEQLGDVQPIEAAGLRSDSMEAECFAWLAVRRLRLLPTSLPETTGCERPTCGGAVTETTDR